jgi:hypothetical protein
MLMICDTGGKVKAITSMASREGFPELAWRESDVAEVLRFGPALSEWVDDRILEARGRDEYSAETVLDNDEVRLFVKLESLRHGEELYGFALQVFSTPASEALCVLHDGDAVVERRQWHEIKNHVGALKLYATFLKRKLPDGDERRTVEKIFSGVNALIGYLDRVRRGDAQ